MAPLREIKINILSPRRKARKGVQDKNQINIEVLGGLGAFAREKNKYNLAEAQSSQRCLGNSKSNIEVLCGLCASARDKNKYISLRRRVRNGSAVKDVWGENKIHIEVLGGLGAFAREKNKYDLAEAQSSQRCSG